MRDRLIVDLHPDQTASVLTWLDGDKVPESTPSFPLTWPFGGKMLEDLRWYLEDYLLLPSGVYGERGPEIAEFLPRWGEAMFAAVFGSSQARDAYSRLLARGSGLMIVFRGPPELLALPWELLREPGRTVPLGLELGGISRSTPSAPVAGTVAVPGRKLRMLMVIARPQGERDVGYQMIARPLLERLDGAVELTVLRPPTFHALQDVLAEAAGRGEPFHVVHFDGHGGQVGEAVLAFERPRGGPDFVPASKLAQALSGTPVVVLNACQSGAIGKDLEAAIVSSLLAEGVASVVAMSFNVHAVAAADFMAAFYEQLFTGSTVGEAVTAGRRRMFRDSNRPSRAGQMPLADWLVPVHYINHDVRFPQAVTARLPSAQGSRNAAELDPAGSFVGRDWLTCQLETALRVQRIALLHGVGGTGKSELAKAFGRWWQQTGGVTDPRHVIFHSFEPGVTTFGLDEVVNQIGQALSLPRFDLLDPAQRHAVAEEELAARRMLLIWDNFETVRSLPDPGGEPLDEERQVELRSFLARLAAGSSMVLITSRSPETWLGDIGRVRVAGLTPPEANQYADQLLATCPAAQARRQDPGFGELMDWLDGHPLAMRLALPHLETTEPGTLLDALRGNREAGADGELFTSLSASVAYSYIRLTGQTRRLLPALVLFQGVASEMLLFPFSHMPGVPQRFRGADEAEWRAALAEAAEAGLLTQIVSDIYRVHPALPAYLAALWQRDDPASYDADYDAAARAMVSACAMVGDSLTANIRSGRTNGAYNVIGLHYRALRSALAYAIEHGMWAAVGSMLDPMTNCWRAIGLGYVAEAWLERARLATESHAAGDAPDRLALALWTATANTLLIQYVADPQLDKAQHIADMLQARLGALPPLPAVQIQLALVHDQLGTIALLRGQPEVADRWYHKALTAVKKLGDKNTTVLVHRHLANLRAAEGDGEMADLHLLESYIHEEDTGRETRAASGHIEDGDLEMRHGRWEAATENYRKALGIYTRTRDQPGSATALQKLGSAAYRGQQWEAAEAWYREALLLQEDADDQHGVGLTYRLLGMVARERDQFDAAEAWYQKALALQQDLGDTPGTLKTLMTLVELELSRNNNVGALDWTIRCVSLAGEFPYPLAGPALDGLVELRQLLGVEMLTDRWRLVTGGEMPEVLRNYLRWE